MGKKKPPQWHRFDRWVCAGAGVGFMIAFGLFCLVQLLVNGTEFFFDFTSETRTPLSDIISMTATALGGLTIGSIAVMQYRKHKWAEYQAKLDEDTRTGERLSKAIEHLGSDELYIRLGAIYEFKRLAKDSHRDKESIVEILTAFTAKGTIVNSKIVLSQDTSAAIVALSYMVRELIEETAEKAGKKNILRPSQVMFKTMFILGRPKIHGEIKWRGLKADCLNLEHIDLKGVRLYEPSFRGTRLCYAYFHRAFISGAHLEGADLRGAIFDDKTDFTNAHIDEHTKFDPGAREKYFPDFGKEKKSGAED